jgi:hypothetical protein
MLAMNKPRCEDWRKLAIQPLTGGQQTSFRHKGHLIVVRRLVGGHCQWLQGDQWLDVYATIRHQSCDPDFRHQMRRACHRLGVRY